MLRYRCCKNYESVYLMTGPAGDPYPDRESCTMTGSPSLTLPGGPGLRGWRAQRPRKEPNLTGKR